MKLPELTRTKAAVITALGKLRFSTADELENAATERMKLEAKLVLLDEAGNAARLKLEADEQAMLLKRRTTLLAAMESKVHSAAKAHVVATANAERLIGELVDVLVKRSLIFSRDSCGLVGDDFTKLLTTEDQRKLLTALNRTTPEVWVGDFSTSWENACAESCDDQQLRSTLNALVSNPGMNHAQPLAAASSDPLKVAIKAVAEAVPVAEVKPQPKAEAVTNVASQSFEVDLRGPGEVRDLNEKVSLTN